MPGLTLAMDGEEMQAYRWYFSTGGALGSFSRFGKPYENFEKYLRRGDPLIRVFIDVQPTELQDVKNGLVSDTIIDYKSVFGDEDEDMINVIDSLGQLSSITGHELAHYIRWVSSSQSSDYTAIRQHVWISHNLQFWTMMLHVFNGGGC